MSEPKPKPYRRPPKAAYRLTDKQRKAVTAAADFLHLAGNRYRQEADRIDYLTRRQPCSQQTVQKANQYVRLAQEAYEHAAALYEAADSRRIEKRCTSALTNSSS